MADIVILSLRHLAGSALLLIALAAADARATPLREAATGNDPAFRTGSSLPAELLIPGGYLASRSPGALRPSAAIDSAREFATPPTGFAGGRAWQAPSWLTLRLEPDQARRDADGSDRFVMIGQSWENDLRDPDESQTSLREIARIIAGSASAFGAARPHGDGDEPGRIDVGINLVRETLELEVDRELAASIIAYSSGIKEFLGPVLSAHRFEVVPAAGAGQEPEARVALPTSLTVSAAELDRIKRDHADERVNSVREFVVGFLLDPRVILFFCLSVLTITAVSLGVLRWTRR